MELYKLCHKKIVLACAVFTALFTIFNIWAYYIDVENATVDGVRYSGYEAVRVNRQITEEYRGVLTDEKISQIVEKYGLPSKAVNNYGGWQDGNYLSNFVADYLSDGYFRSWDRYKVPTRVYAIADTELGALQDAMGKGILFAYTNGWKALFSSLQMGMMLASILIVISVSVVFAQEGQSNMLPLLFTTQEGKNKDVRAKIAAAFTLTILVYSAVVLLCMVVCVCIFGLDGGDCPLLIALSGETGFYVGSFDGNQASYMTVRSFLWMILGMNLLAMLLLCAMMLCVSAYCKNNFTAVSTAAIVWCMPLLIRMLFGGFGYFFATCMPIFVIMTYTVYESLLHGSTVAMLPVILVLFVFCVVEGHQVYRKSGE
ncbi:MAG: ABC transporter permease [Eubacterium sp.]|nr:ABC transporter permease [Eubacterium sp.]